MRKLHLTATVFCFAATILQSAHASGSVKHKPYLSVKEQRTAIVDCQYELGLRGWPKLNVTYVEKPWGGPSYVRMLPNRNISSQQAAQINACADQKLGRETVEATGPIRIQTECARSYSVMVGGSGYCQSGW